MNFVGNFLKAGIKALLTIGFVLGIWALLSYYFPEIQNTLFQMCDDLIQKALPLLGERQNSISSQLLTPLSVFAILLTIFSRFFCVELLWGIFAGIGSLFSSKEDTRSARDLMKAGEKEARIREKQAAKEAKIAEAEAAKQAKMNEKLATLQAKEDAKAAEKAAKEQAIADKAQAKADAKAAKQNKSKTPQATHADEDLNIAPIAAAATAATLATAKIAEAMESDNATTDADAIDEAIPDLDIEPLADAPDESTFIDATPEREPETHASDDFSPELEVLTSLGNDLPEIADIEEDDLPQIDDLEPIELSQADHLADARDEVAEIVEEPVSDFELPEIDNLIDAQAEDTLEDTPIIDTLPEDDLPEFEEPQSEVEDLTLPDIEDLPQEVDVLEQSDLALDTPADFADEAEDTLSLDTIADDFSAPLEDASSQAEDLPDVADLEDLLDIEDLPALAENTTELELTDAEAIDPLDEEPEEDSISEFGDEDTLENAPLTEDEALADIKELEDLDEIEDITALPDLPDTPEVEDMLADDLLEDLPDLEDLDPYKLN
ncbi:hypothetical protein [Hirschia litorea]|uniref:Uncharacterized protein n=1 Tax=Hirschia litorea TaxID=1199156 RepID=A0ABW2IK33_9PROT